MKGAAMKGAAAMSQNAVATAAAEAAGVRREAQAGEGRAERGRGPCRQGAEEERLLQAPGHPEHETGKEGRRACSQGREPLHQGALRLQGQACLQEGQGLGAEEAEGPCELSPTWPEAA